MRSANRSDRSPALHARARSSWRAAALVLVCAPLSACASPVEPGPTLGQLSGAIKDQNGLDPGKYSLSALKWNGYATGGLSWKPLHTTGLHTGGAPTANTMAWLTWLAGRGDGSINVMRYLVACAVPSGTAVSATVKGTSYIWYGEIGLAPGWAGASGLSTADQEWVSACLAAHVNLAGDHVEFSLHGENPALGTTSSEVRAYSCREAAFMGNLFAGWETDPLPITQCHDSTRLTDTGRTCDAAEDSFKCTVDCFAACDPTSDDYTSCAVSVNGSPRSYQHVITTYLPKDDARGCLGVGYDVTSHWAHYTDRGTSQHWSWSWNYPGVSASSCNARCGGYAPSCSCTPDCKEKGTCCSDYDDLCGTPPDPYDAGPISAATIGQSTCPAGYTRRTGSLSSSNTEDSYSFRATATGTQHATLYRPPGTDFSLKLEHIASDGTSSLLAESNHAGSSESLHYFYGHASVEYWWRVQRNSGSGDYVLCTSQP